MQQYLQKYLEYYIAPISDKSVLYTYLDLYQY